jgi:hypothetical protein
METAGNTMFARSRNSPYLEAEKSSSPAYNIFKLISTSLLLIRLWSSPLLSLNITPQLEFFHVSYLKQYSVPRRHPIFETECSLLMRERWINPTSSVTPSFTYRCQNPSELISSYSFHDYQKVTIFHLPSPDWCHLISMCMCLSLGVSRQETCVSMSM